MADHPGPPLERADASGMRAGADARAPGDLRVATRAAQGGASQEIAPAPTLGALGA